jgi:hypothetical protein
MVATATDGTSVSCCLAVDAFGGVLARRAGTVARVSISELVKESGALEVSVDKLRDLAQSGVLGLLPDRVYEVDGQLVAAFRPDAQAIRVAAQTAGVSVEMVAPEGAELAMRSQYMAVWVLPVLAGALVGVPCQVLATLIAARLEAGKRRSEAPPEVVLREIFDEDGKVRERELRGPAQEIEQLLRERAEPVEE